MNNPDNVIVTPWKIEEVPLNHWFKHEEAEFGPARISCIRSQLDAVCIEGYIISLDSLATHYLHSEHPVGDKANWQRCGHIEPRGVVWVGRDDLYFRKDTAVINGVRYAVDGAEALEVGCVNTPTEYKFSVANSWSMSVVAKCGKNQISQIDDHPLDVVPAIRMEAK